MPPIAADAQKAPIYPATTAAYQAQAEAELACLRQDKSVEGLARNVIIFIGDGMGVSTLTAARNQHDGDGPAPLYGLSPNVLA